MIETERMKMIKSLYQGEIKELCYDEITREDGITLINVYIKLDDGFDTKLNLGIIGVSTEEKKKEKVLDIKKYLKNSNKINTSSYLLNERSVLLWKKQ